MDVEAVLAGLRSAVSLQSRAALEATAVAGSLRGVQWQPVSTLLWSFATEELADLRRLIEKLTALGGAASAASAAFELAADPEAAVASLIDHECEAVAALHAIIPATGQEPRSEALEHRLEHMIMRKQEQVDTLRRILDRTG